MLKKGLWVFSMIFWLVSCGERSESSLQQAEPTEDLVEVVTAGNTKNLLNGGSGGVSINIYGNVYGIDDLERVIESAIQKAENKLMRSVSFGLDSGYEV